MGHLIAETNELTRILSNLNAGDSWIIAASTGPSVVYKFDGPKCLASRDIAFKVTQIQSQVSFRSDTSSV